MFRPYKQELCKQKCLNNLGLSFDLYNGIFLKFQNLKKFIFQTELPVTTSFYVLFFDEKQHRIPTRKEYQVLWFSYQNEGDRAIVK